MIMSIVNKISKLLEKLYKLIIRKSYKADLLILDDFYPCPLSEFRFVEYNSYLSIFTSSMALSTGEDLKLLGEVHTIEYYIEKSNFAHKIKMFNPFNKIEAKLAICVFLTNTYHFLPFIEKNGIPFIFTLYPGSGFRIDDENCNTKLRIIFNSRYFRKVIVTQNLTYNYIIKKELCAENKIEYIYGCPMSDITCINTQRNLMKNRIDICFTAAKYMPKGRDKGYDIFIDVARILSAKHNILFHVIGGFDALDISVEDIKEQIIFYGYKPVEEIRKIYSKMDIILSPNRSNELLKGAFDGFPTASVVEAGLQGVLMILTDDQRQNEVLLDGVECVIVNHDPVFISKKIENLIDNRKLLRSIALNGQNKLRKLFSTENQIERRIQIIDNIIKNDE